MHTNAWLAPWEDNTAKTYGTRRVYIGNVTQVVSSTEKVVPDLRSEEKAADNNIQLIRNWEGMPHAEGLADG